MQSVPLFNKCYSTLQEISEVGFWCKEERVNYLKNLIANLEVNFYSLKLNNLKEPNLKFGKIFDFLNILKFYLKLNIKAINFLSQII